MFGSMFRNRNMFSGDSGITSDDPSSPDYDPYNTKKRFSKVDFGADDALAGHTAVTSNVSDRPEGQDTNPFGDAYGRIMKEEPGPQHKAYLDTLNNPPNKDDYKPSKGRKLAAIIAGLSGDPNAGRGVMDANFNDANDEYQERLKRLKEGADVENADTTQKRQLYAKIIDDEKSRRALAERHDVDQSTIAANNARAKSLAGPRFGPGWNADGTHKQVIMDGNSPDGYRIGDFGRVGPTAEETDQRITNRGKTLAGYTSGLAHNRWSNEREGRIEDANAVNDHSSSNTSARQLAQQDRAKAEREAADANNPNRQYARRTMAYIDVMDEHPELKDKVSRDETTGLYESEDPQVRELVQAKLKRKGAATPSKRIVR